MNIVVLGSSGLVGGLLVQELLKDPKVNKIILPVRKITEESKPKVEFRQFDFNKTEEYRTLYPADAVICALGTTIKKAGSQEAFRKVDYDFPLYAAKAAVEAGVQHFLLVSSIGANSNAQNFYLRVKGELEEAIKHMSFPSITIVRPSLLTGDRKEFRLGERLMQPFAPLFPAKYKPIAAIRVARALSAQLHTQNSGVMVLESMDLQKY